MRCKYRFNADLNRLGVRGDRRAALMPLIRSACVSFLRGISKALSFPLSLADGQIDATHNDSGPAGITIGKL